MSNQIVPMASSYTSLCNFLRQHQAKDTGLEKTHTRIGKTNNKTNTPEIYGGAYHISDSEQETFMNIYNNEILSTKKKEYLTEKQLKKDGPICIDLDFKYAYDIDEKQYTQDHIEDFIDEVGNILKTMYSFDNETNFKLLVLEKEKVNRLQDKDITKDGIHVIIWIKSSLIIQQMLRTKLLKVVPVIWADLPLLNSWEDVIDERVTKGEANWQLIGSRKPDHDKYNIKYVYEMQYDDKDNEFRRKQVKISKTFKTDNLLKLSIRYSAHESFLLQETFLKELRDYEDLYTAPRMIHMISNNTMTMRDTSDIKTLLEIKDQPQLDYLIECFIAKNNATKLLYQYNTILEYVMILPEKYYELGSYDKWLRIGWVLFNISNDSGDLNRFLLVWIKFSSRAKSFNYSVDIFDICDRWQKFDMKLYNNLTKLSLYHWAKLDAPFEYNRIRKNTTDHYVNETLKIIPGVKQSSCGDFDLALVLHNLLKDKFVCVSIGKNIWYEYIGHRWKLIDSGTTLRTAISTILKQVYVDKATDLMPELHREGNDEEKENDNDKKSKSLRTLNIAAELSVTKKKNNIVTESRDLFYDGDFVLKLDINPYLLGFTNGVYDFSENVFRNGKPEDNISFCTGIDYIDINTIGKYKGKPISTIKNDINKFMDSLFPIPELCKYMWEHLASSLVGTCLNQTFNMYLGAGNNGKSILVLLMEKVLGDYKTDVPLNLITDKRGKIGGVTPEIVGLKGKRYAVLQEPSKHDQLNEGVMKQLTSGKDQVQGRSPFAIEPVKFLPQFNLVITCNCLLKVNSTDKGTWRRIRTVPFLSLFADKPVDNDLNKPYQFLVDRSIDEKFDNWKEVFASMLVEICARTKGRVSDCDTVLERSKEYEKSQDFFSEYIEERIITSEDSSKFLRKSDINLDFKAWYESSYDAQKPNYKELHEQINTRFGAQRNSRWTKITFKPKYDEVEESQGFQGMYDGINTSDL